MERVAVITDIHANLAAAGLPAELAYKLVLGA
jgi:hypothetical protein